jgi:hypothetical protein
MGSFFEFCRELYHVQPVRLFDRITQWIVVGWLIAHTASWVVVEFCRLGRATQLKLRRIFQQDVAEE